MPTIEGIVTRLKGDGLAVVFFRPPHSGIPGAPDVNVCHCASDGSSFTFEAVNGAHASPGDVVSVYRSPGALLKNAAALIGAPLAGLLLGMAAGLAWSGGAWAAERISIPAAAGLLLGLGIGIRAFRRLSAQTPAVITHILQKRAVDPSTGESPVCSPGGGAPSRAVCEGCGRNTSFSTSFSASP